jgi:hypothetical protein
LQGRLAIGSDGGIGDGQVREGRLGQVGVWMGGQGWLVAPQHQSTTGIGEAAATNGKPCLFGQARSLRIGSQKDIKGRTVGDLGVEFAGGCGTERESVAALLAEQRAKTAGGIGKVGGNGNPGIRGTNGLRANDCPSAALASGCWRHPVRARGGGGLNRCKGAMRPGPGRR